MSRCLRQEYSTTKAGLFLFRFQRALGAKRVIGMRVNGVVMVVPVVMAVPVVMPVIMTVEMDVPVAVVVPVAFAHMACVAVRLRLQTA